MTLERWKARIDAVREEVGKLTANLNDFEMNLKAEKDGRGADFNDLNLQAGLDDGVQDLSTLNLWIEEAVEYLRDGEPPEELR